MVFSSRYLLPLWWKNAQIRQQRQQRGNGIARRGKGIETAFSMQVINHINIMIKVPKL